MIVDHIFIFTDGKGEIADNLVDFGLIEGSSRVHVGQGTTNRKFYFSNFFLEILWVHDESELNSEQTKTTGLWQRAAYKTNYFSPFGICLVNSENTQKLFKNAFKHQPDYFPKGMTIDIIKNDNQPDLPWTFQLPFAGQKKNENEPKNHSNGLKNLSKVVFEYKQSVDDQYIEYFESSQQIAFSKSTRNWIKLIFDDGKQGKSKDFQELKLTVRY